VTLVNIDQRATVPAPDRGKPVSRRHRSWGKIANRQTAHQVHSLKLSCYVFVYGCVPFRASLVLAFHSMCAHFEFDARNRVLLLRAEGLFTEELVRNNQASMRKYSTATDARVGIFDLSGVTEFVLSTPFIRSLAKEAPSMSASYPLIIVVPSTHGFGLSRMFQSLGDQTRPLLQVVRTMEEALSTLTVPSTHFEPLN
jgi:hypothetical protein